MKRTLGKVSLALILSLIFALFSVNFTAFAEGDAVKSVTTGASYATIADGASANNSGENSWYVVDNHGTLTIEENASVKATGLYSSLIRNMGTDSSNTAKIYVKGGEMENQFIALKNDDFSELYVSGGTITSPEQAIQNWTKVEVTGGTLNGDVYTWNWSSEPSVNYYDDPNHVPNGPQITVTDGASVSGNVILKNYKNGSLTKADPKADDTKGSIKVTGEGTKINTDKSGDDAFIDPSFCAEHVWGEKVTVQPTEFTTGTKVIYCTRCNTVDHEESIDILPSTVGHTHRWGEWKVRSDPRAG